jgi:hypothetical protein
VGCRYLCSSQWVALSAENQTLKELAVAELKTEDIEGNHKLRLFKIGIDARYDAYFFVCLLNTLILSACGCTASALSFRSIMQQLESCQSCGHCSFDSRHC